MIFLTWFSPLVPAFNVSVNRLALLIIIIVGVLITSGLVFMGVKTIQRRNKKMVEPTRINNFQENPSKLPDKVDDTMKIQSNSISEESIQPNQNSDTLKSGVSGTEALISDKSRSSIGMHSRSESPLGLTPRRIVTSVRNIGNSNNNF